MLVYVTSDVELEIKQSQLKCNSFCEKGFFYDYLGVLFLKILAFHFIEKCCINRKGNVN